MLSAANPNKEHLENGGTTPASYAFEVFFDGECPLCVKEINLLRRLDKKQCIQFTDIALDEFDDTTVGIPWETLMARIHGRMPDGTIVEGVEVFRKLYGAVGFKTAVAFTRLPGISTFFDAAYSVFAKNRLKMTGRCDDAHCKPGHLPEDTKVQLS